MGLSLDAAKAAFASANEVENAGIIKRMNDRILGWMKKIKEEDKDEWNKLAAGMGRCDKPGFSINFKPDRDPQFKVFFTKPK